MHEYLIKLMHTSIGRNTLLELVEKLKYEITDKNIIIRNLENDLSTLKKNETESFSKLITLYTEIREAQLRITQLNGENSNLEVSFKYECLYLFIFMNTFM
jgi:predicted CopG family antitoxin